MLFCYSLLTLTIITFSLNPLCIIIVLVWYVGGQSQYSIATVDVDGMAGRNEDRMRRLDAILNAGTQSYSAATDVRRRDEDPSYSAATNVRRDVRRMDVDPVRDSESIISNFLQRTSGQPSLSRGSERSLECDTAYQRLATPNT